MQRARRKPKKQSVVNETFSRNSKQDTQLDQANVEVKVLTRTEWLPLADYCQFKAARTIQTALRGWIVRRRLQRLRLSSTIIQRQWRRFFAKRKEYQQLESTLQERIHAHFYRSAVIIQKFWRGFWVRQHIHNHRRRRHMQEYAGEELLYCVAFKLHHLLRTHQIPGIFSLRNSNCFSKVEKLLAAMRFQHQNINSRWAHSKRQSQLRKARNDFQKSKYHTAIPYDGPNINNKCSSRCNTLYTDPEVESKMHKILSFYERSTMDPVMKQKNEKNEKTATIKRRLTAEEIQRKKKDNFCTDVIESMRRWHILQEKKLDIDPNVFRNPINVEKFLNEAQSIASLLHERCECNIKI